MDIDYSDKDRVPEMSFVNYLMFLFCQLMYFFLDDLIVRKVGERILLVQKLVTAAKGVSTVAAI